MEICSRFTGMERKDGAFLLHTDNADIKVCFVTGEIVRVRASFDHELAEESYVLMTTKRTYPRHRFQYRVQRNFRDKRY